MARSFFPSKWWEWVVALVCVLILGAIFLPVYAYSGPGLSHYRVARDLQMHHQQDHGWFRDEAAHTLNRIPSGRSYSYALKRKSARGAVYRIVVDGRAEFWHVDDKRRPRRLAVE